MHWCGDGNKYTQQQATAFSIGARFAFVGCRCRFFSLCRSFFVHSLSLAASLQFNFFFFCCCSLVSLSLSLSLSHTLRANDVCMCSNVNKVRSLIIIGWLQAILFRIWFSRKHWASICCCWMSRYFAFCKWFVIGLPCMHAIHAHTQHTHVHANCRCASCESYACVQMCKIRCLVGWLLGWSIGRSAFGWFGRPSGCVYACLSAICRLIANI